MKAESWDKHESDMLTSKNEYLAKPNSITLGLWKQAVADAKYYADNKKTNKYHARNNKTKKHDTLIAQHTDDIQKIETDLAEIQRKADALEEKKRDEIASKKTIEKPSEKNSSVSKHKPPIKPKKRETTLYQYDPQSIVADLDKQLGLTRPLPSPECAPVSAEKYTDIPLPLEDHPKKAAEMGNNMPTPAVIPDKEKESCCCFPFTLWKKSKKEAKEAEPSASQLPYNKMT